MQKRYISIWFCFLKTDWLIRRQPQLKEIPFVLASPDHGRMIVTGANGIAQKLGVVSGMALADARAIIPSLQFFDEGPRRSAKVLAGLAEWSIRYTPTVSIDLPDALVLDITGCAYLWGSEQLYLTDISTRLENFGYHIRAAIADTVGAAWAIARFGKDGFIIEKGQQTKAILSLPPSALRLETETIERLEKLGLRQISTFISMPRPALRRRFGPSLLKKLDQALGYEQETIEPIYPIEPHQDRLPCLEPIVTLTGIEIALQRLLNNLCKRLKQEEKGLRTALFMCYRIDGKVQTIEIGTHRPSANTKHLFKLFENKISTIEPALGIELFTLKATKVDDLLPLQEKLWEHAGVTDDIALSELLDRIAGKTGGNHVHRYLPDEHYWPERSYKVASSLYEKTKTSWKVDRPRPVQLLSTPEPIEVTAPVPDYPPMLFRYKGKLHKIIKADGPERIEPEWWLQEGQHRDYYYVEDEEGCRYWLFRSGHYDVVKSFKWFLHGFFA
jgi:protein ImuB